MKMPPECKIEKELTFFKCNSCKIKCDYGRTIVTAYKKYINDTEWEDKRQEIKDEYEALR
jgi:hypothetical protein